MSPQARILKAVESDFHDYCGHIFEWDPAWDGSVLELHCPECLERARVLASQIAAALEPETAAGAGRFVARRVETVEAKRVQEPYGEVAAWCDGYPVKGGPHRPDTVLGIGFHSRPPYGGRSWFAESGDWIVKAEDGSFRAMDAEQFAAEYAPEANHG